MFVAIRQSQNSARVGDRKEFIADIRTLRPADDHDGAATGAHIDIASALQDMVTFNGGPLSGLA